MTTTTQATEISQQMPSQVATLPKRSETKSAQMRGPYDPGFVERLKHKMLMSERANAAKISQAIERKKLMAEKRKVILLMMKYRQQEKGVVICDDRRPLTAERVFKEDVRQLHVLHHQIMIENCQHRAAIKIQNLFRAYIKKKEFNIFMKTIVKL